MKSSEYEINPMASILEALKKINQNKKGFLLVVDDGKLVGTLTDGDIRRQLILGSSISDSIAFKKDYKFILKGASFEIACSLFMLGIKFVPIIDASHNLVSVVTKEQFEVFLLQDRNWSTDFDFRSISEQNFHIHNRPWGFYKSTMLCDFVQSKVLTIFPGQQLSLQEHQRREEHWVIIRGQAKVVLGGSIIDAYPGKYIFIPKQTKHQIVNDSHKNLVLSEVQLGDYFGEDDIKRYSDKYGRPTILGDEE
jgi:mannose-1-phosphate guanylyltransferase / mannose-6-phosphate isomerase